MAISIDFSGRVALVTGGSRGIGAGIAGALGEAGAAVAVNYLARAGAAESVAQAIRAGGGRAVAVGADVSNAGEVARMMAEVEAALGPVDILVNNAGIGEKADIDTLTEELFDRTIAVNLKSAFLCTRACFPGMRARGWGRIVNVTSGAARGPGGIGVHYNASKAGMEAMTRAYAARLAGDGVTVNAVAPSLILTDMLPVSIEEACRRIPVGRPGEPAEVASVVLMMVANGYLTGQTVQVNGGLSFV